MDKQTIYTCIFVLKLMQSKLASQLHSFETHRNNGSSDVLLSVISHYQTELKRIHYALNDLYRLLESDFDEVLS